MKANSVIRNKCTVTITRSGLLIIRKRGGVSEREIGEIVKDTAR